MSIQDAAITSEIGEALTRLARGRPEDLAALLHDVEVHTTIAGTRVTSHCHLLKLDGNNRPRVRDLVKAICDNVLDFAIPRSQIAVARAELDAHGSTAKLVRLEREARNLFTDLVQSGEGGELLLFVMAERLLRLPQIICKMDLKTNRRMHVHGADGLHAGVDEETNKLVLYWGESKIHADAASAIRDCLRSLGPVLRDDPAEEPAGERDFQLLQRYADVNNADLEMALRQFLDPENEHFNSLEFQGLALVGFNSNAYPVAPQTASLEEVQEAIKQVLPSWKSQIENHLKAEKLEQFGFHFICVPFPSVEDFRLRLRKELGLE